MAVSLNKASGEPNGPEPSLAVCLYHGPPIAENQARDSRLTAGGQGGQDCR
jgi:hypothetical protein